MLLDHSLHFFLATSVNIPLGLFASSIMSVEAAQPGYIARLHSLVSGTLVIQNTRGPNTNTPQCSELGSSANKLS